MAIRKVNKDDLNQLRLIRNKWQGIGIFRQAHLITPDEQLDWYKKNKDNVGYIINGRAYGKIYDDGEVAFYGFDEWIIEDLYEMLKISKSPIFYGECYLLNPFLVPFWLRAGFKVKEGLVNRKCWQGKMWDSLLLEMDNDFSKR